jgi:hypothetical protein
MTSALYILLWILGGAAVGAIVAVWAIKHVFGGMGYEP